MTVARNRKLIELKNIGEKIAARLNEVGIFSEEQLRSIGASKAHKLLKNKYPNETLAVCYYLYSFGETHTIHSPLSTTLYSSYLVPIAISRSSYISILRRQHSFKPEVFGFFLTSDKISITNC